MTKIKHKGRYFYSIFDKRVILVYSIISTITFMFSIVVLNLGYIAPSEDRDKIKINHLNNFREKALSKKISQDSDILLPDYYYKVKDGTSLAGYFFEDLPNNLKFDSKGSGICSQNTIFRTKTTIDTSGKENISIYVGICLENSDNHLLIGKHDNGFFNKYYEFIIGDWTKEEVLDGFNIQDVILSDIYL